MEACYTVRIEVKVHNTADLFLAAEKIALQHGGVDLLGTEGDPDVAACLQMILDPGSVPYAGFDIDHCAVER